MNCCHLNHDVCGNQFIECVRCCLWLSYGFQTLRRLPASKYILFTVRTYTDPLHRVLEYPAAAQALAAVSVRAPTYALDWGASPSTTPFDNISRDDIYAPCIPLQGIRRKYKAGWLARGFGARKPTKVMLRALDEAAEKGGLLPGLKGRVLEPWERRATVDGTLWPQEDQVGANQEWAVDSAQISPD